MTINYLEISDILLIHRELQRSFAVRGGIQSRDMLLSAMAQPRQGFGGACLHPSVFDKAAAYIFFLSKNHPFEDGNKRVAFLAAMLFLKNNEAPEPAFATGEATEFMNKVVIEHLPVPIISGILAEKSEVLTPPTGLRR